MKRTSPWHPLLVAISLSVMPTEILAAPGATPATSDPQATTQPARLDIGQAATNPAPSAQGPAPGPSDPQPSPEGGAPEDSKPPPVPATDAPVTAGSGQAPQPAAEPATKPAVAPRPAGGDKLTPYSGKGFLLSSSDGGKYSLTMTGRLQIGTVLLDGNQETQFWPDIYSARFIFTGNVVSRDIFYMMQLGFGEQERYYSPTPLLDAWIDFRQIPEAHVRIGTLDKHAPRHSSANNVLTMDSIVHYELDLFRDVGIRVYSDKPFGTDKLKYIFELSSGKGMTYLTQPTVFSVLYYGRVEVSPLGAFDNTRLGDQARRQKPAFSLALQGAYNQNAIFPMSDWFAPGQVPFQQPFNYVHASADLVFKWHGFSLLATSIYRRATTLSHEVQDSSGLPVTEYSRNGWGWFTVASMMLTDRLEVASRIGALYQIGRPAGLVATAPYQAEGFTQAQLADVRNLREAVGGLSYYFVGHSFKIQADYARIFIGNFREGVSEFRTMLSLQL